MLSLKFDPKLFPSPFYWILIPSVTEVVTLFPLNLMTSFRMFPYCNPKITSKEIMHYYLCATLQQPQPTSKFWEKSFFDI